MDKGSNRRPDRVVAVCCGAGGLEATMAFVEQLAPSSRDAIVCLSLASFEERAAAGGPLRASTLPYEHLSETVSLEGGRVYFTLPNLSLNFTPDGRVMVAPDTSCAIDRCLSSLAAAHGAQGIAVILGGSAAEGIEGAQAVLAAGGTVLVQRPDTTTHPTLPRALVEAGTVSMVLAPEDLPGWIEARLDDGARLPSGPPREVERLTDLRRLLGREAAIQLSHYKGAAIGRALRNRRLALKLATQVAYLNEYAVNDSERLAFSRSISEVDSAPLWTMTPQFQALRALLEKKAQQVGARQSTLRIWSAACGRGTEPWLLAILADKAGVAPSTRIFATDLDADTIAFAQRGLFDASLAQQISAEWLETYFEPSGAGYRACDRLRGMINFARHDLLEHPPFARIDLLVCRNLFGFLTGLSRRMVTDRLVRSIRPGGHLAIGADIQVPGMRRTEIPGLLHRAPAADPWHSPTPCPTDIERAGPCHDPLHSALLSLYAPPALIVGRHGSITHAQGDVQLIYAATGAGDRARHNVRNGRLQLLLAAFWRRGQLVRHSDLVCPTPDGPKRATLVAQPLPDQPASVLVTLELEAHSSK